MIILVLILLIRVLVLLWRKRIVHEVSTTLLVSIVLSAQIVLLLVGVERLWKGRRGGRIGSTIRLIIIFLILEREI